MTWQKRTAHRVTRLWHQGIFTNVSRILDAQTDGKRAVCARFPACIFPNTARQRPWRDISPAWHQLPGTPRTLRYTSGVCTCNSYPGGWSGRAERVKLRPVWGGAHPLAISRMVGYGVACWVRPSVGRGLSPRLASYTIQLAASALGVAPHGAPDAVSSRVGAIGSAAPAVVLLTVLRRRRSTAARSYHKPRVECGLLTGYYGVCL